MSTSNPIRARFAVRLEFACRTSAIAAALGAADEASAYALAAVRLADAAQALGMDPRRLVSSEDWSGVHTRVAVLLEGVRESWRRMRMNRTCFGRL